MFDCTVTVELTTLVGTESNNWVHVWDMVMKARLVSPLSYYPVVQIDVLNFSRTFLLLLKGASKLLSQLKITFDSIFHCYRHGAQLWECCDTDHIQTNAAQMCVAFLKS